MKAEFRGWSREVYTHKHDVELVGKRGGKLKVGLPVFVDVSDSNTKFSGKIENLGLTGDFLMTLSISDEELEELLLQKAKKDPHGSVSLFGSLQAVALAEALRPPKAQNKLFGAE